MHALPLKNMRSQVHMDTTESEHLPKLAAMPRPLCQRFSEQTVTTEKASTLRVCIVEKTRELCRYILLLLGERVRDGESERHCLSWRRRPRCRRSCSVTLVPGLARLLSPAATSHLGHPDRYTCPGSSPLLLNPAATHPGQPDRYTGPARPGPCSSM